MPSDQCDGHADGRVHGGQELRAALTGLAKISAVEKKSFHFG